ncbi:MAG: hypothetical protein ABI587_10125 [Gemmatimonadales bacterium]
MDRHTLALLIPIFALAIPVSAIIFRSLIKLQQLRIEETRLRVGAGDHPADDSLGQEVAQLRQELSEVQERLDFTERMLAQSREAPRLPGPQ